MSDPPPAQTPHPRSGESCPLCGAPLAEDQDWCLRCGAAARTRIAATPRWRLPLTALLVVAALCVAILAASVVKLARGTGPVPAPITTTITGTAPPGASTTPGATTAPDSTTTP